MVMVASLALGSDGRLRRFGLHPRPRLRFLSAPDSGRSHADVAQLVEHHLAKVRVAGSNPVVRSERVSPLGPSTGRPFEAQSGSPRTCAPHQGRDSWSWWSGREARQRTANPCTRVQIPSPPRAVGAAVARFPDTEEVAGSIPVPPTEKTRTVLAPARTVLSFPLHGRGEAPVRLGGSVAEVC